MARGQQNGGKTSQSNQRLPPSSIGYILHRPTHIAQDENHRKIASGHTADTIAATTGTTAMEQKKVNKSKIFAKMEMIVCFCATHAFRVGV